MFIAHRKNSADALIVACTIFTHKHNILHSLQIPHNILDVLDTSNHTR